MKRHVSSDEKTIIENINAELDRRGWSVTYLASKVGLPRDRLSKCLNSKLTTLSTGLALTIARLFDTTVQDLAGGGVRNREEEFDPFRQLPKTLLGKFAEHETPRGRFWTFDRLPACPRMTADVQNKLHLSRFGALRGTQDGVPLVEKWNEWGNARRKKYLAHDLNELPKVTTVMLRSDFEKLIKAEPPFECCTLEEIRDCLEHLRHRCVTERGFRLVLVNDKRLPEDLRLKLGPLEALGAIGQNFVFSKTIDTKVVWTEEKRRVDDAVMILKRLQQLASKNADVTSVLSQLDEYQRIIDDELRKGGRQKTKKSLDESWDRVRANISVRPK